MNRKVGSTFSTALILFFLCTAMLGSAKAQNPSRGLSEGDTFTYSRQFIWDSYDPELTLPPNVYWAGENNSIVTVRIGDISSPIVNVEETYHFQNGTERTINFAANLQTGENDNPPLRFYALTYLLQSFKLIQSQSTAINYTDSKTYQDGSREVNVVSFLDNSDTLVNATQYPQELTWEIHYDKQTGIFVEARTKTFTHNPDNKNLNSTFQQICLITSTNVWTVPEFPSFLVLPLLMTAVAMGTLLYRKKVNQVHF